MPLEKKTRQELVNSFISHFFSEKINPQKFLQIISELLNDNILMAEIEKQWENKNKEIEKKIYKQFGTNSAKEIKQLADEKQVQFNAIYKISKSLEDFSENEVKNWLPVDKLMYNKEIFHNRLRGVDFNNLDSKIENRIIQSLLKESKGLTKQEVILYYSLIKANKLSTEKDQIKMKRQQEEKKYFKALASALLGLVYPKRINAAIIAEINDGVKVERDSIRDTLHDKIQNQRFSPYPYLIFFGIHKDNKLFEKFVSMVQLIKYFGDDPEKLMNYTIFYIIFKNSSENFQKICNLQKSALDFLNNKSNGPFSNEGAAYIRLLDTFFYALCTQIYDINRKYQQADDAKKAKIYKLYSAPDRLKMIVQNSLSVAFKVTQRLNADHKRLFSTVTRFVEKEKDFIKKEDIFANVFDFEKSLLSF
ncbi:MAG: hypothetical protein ACOCV8_00535 [Spirochaetota bacterium]